MAQSLTRNENLNIDPELAFVCSSLRNYGKLLMTSFLIDDYRKTKALATKVGYDQAYQSIFGIQPLQLGQYLLKTSHLPRNITDTLRDVSPEAFAQLAESPEEQLLAISELCVQISEVTFDNAVSPEYFDQSVQSVLDRFEKRLPIELANVSQALIEIDTNLENFSQTIGTDSSAAPAAKIVSARVSGENLPELPPEAMPYNSLQSAKARGQMSPQERETHAEASFQDAEKRISEEGAKPTIDMGNIYKIATRAILEGLGLSTCMVFVQEKEKLQSNDFAARFGHGDLYKAIRNRPFVSSRKRDIFSICINRKEDILIQDVNAGKIRSVIPDWIDTDDRNHSLILLPIVAESEVFAIVLGSMDQGTLQLGKGDHQRLKDIRLLLSELEVQTRLSILGPSA